jgi:hypothetical protein
MAFAVIARSPALAERRGNPFLNHFKVIIEEIATSRQDIGTRDDKVLLLKPQFTGEVL